VYEILLYTRRHNLFIRGKIEYTYTISHRHTGQNYTDGLFIFFFTVLVQVTSSNNLKCITFLYLSNF